MGRKGVCGKPGKGVLHLLNKKFLELFGSSKNLLSGEKYFFDTLNRPRLRVGDDFFDRCEKERRCASPFHYADSRLFCLLCKNHQAGITRIWPTLIFAGSFTVAVLAA